MNETLNAVPQDPPVQSWRWVTETPLDLNQAPATTGLSAEAWSRVRRHDAVWVDGHPGRDQAPAGARLAVYAFESPPPPLDFPLEILFDEAGVVAANKPSRLSTQRTRSSALRSLEARLRAHLDDPGLRAVHRLDRDTSGVVLFARDGKTTGRLHAEFRERRVAKRYVARVAGQPKDAFVVSGRLARVAAPSAEPAPLRMEMAAEGRDSETRFEVLSRDDGGALVRAHPVTGRTHQIRVHLRHLGHPIDGDLLYEGRSAPRMMLHAAGIKIRIDGRPRTIECPPPPCFVSPPAAAAPR